MSDKHIKKTSVVTWCFVALFVVLVVAAIYIVKSVLSDNSPRKKNFVETVTLLKPPPPPQIKEKPPEPEPPKEIQKKEEIVDPGPKDEPSPQNSDKPDNAPAGDKLGLDAEGGAGGDAFGLVGKKGGRSLLAGGGGNGLGKLSLLAKYGGYAHIVESEIRKKVMKRLEEEGGIPKGKHQAVVRISLDSNGAVIGCKITGSSGINNIDDAIKKALAQFRISEPPPDGMPRKMDIRVTYQI